MNDATTLQREQAIDGQALAREELAKLCAVDAAAAPWWIDERRFDLVLGSELRAIAEPDLAPRVMALIDARPTEVRLRVANRIRPHGRSRKFGLLILATSAVAACVMATLMVGRPATTAVGNHITVGYVDHTQPLLRGAVIAPSQPQELSFLDGTVVWISAGTHLSIDDAPDHNGQRAKLLRLTIGDVLIQASAQPPGLPLRILTPQAEVEVVGTRFRVAVSAETSVQVTEGTVAFTATTATSNKHQRLLVGPGQKAITSSAGPVYLVPSTAAPARPHDLHVDAKQPLSPLLAVGSQVIDPTDSARVALSGAELQQPCYGVALYGSDRQSLPVIKSASRLSFRAYLDAPADRAVEVWVRISTGEDHWARLALLPARRWTLCQIDLAEGSPSLDVPKSLGVPTGSLLSQLCIFINRAEPDVGAGAVLLVDDIDIVSDQP